MRTPASKRLTPRRKLCAGTTTLNDKPPFDTTVGGRFFCRCLKLPFINNIMLAGQYYAYKTYYTCKTIFLQGDITLTKRYYACKTYYTLTKHITLAKRYFVGKTSCGRRLLGARRRIYLRMLSQILSTAMIRAMRKGISSSLPSSSKESAPIMPRMTSICLRMVPIT